MTHFSFSKIIIASFSKHGLEQLLFIFSIVVLGAIFILSIQNTKSLEKLLKISKESIFD